MITQTKKHLTALSLALTLMIAALCTTSCDALVEYRFQLRNERPEAIHVAYSVEGKRHEVSVPADSSILLFAYKAVGDGRKDIFKDSLSLFQYISVEGSAAGPTACIARDKWDMEWENNYRVLYNLPIK